MATSERDDQYLALIEISIATSALIGGIPVPGVEMRIGQMEIEVDRVVTTDELVSS